MELKIKINDLLNAVPMINQVMDRKMPEKLAYALAKNFRLINAELEDYNKTRTKLLSENWTLDPKTNKYDIPDEDKERWNKMHEELANSESGYIPFKIDMALTQNIDWSPGELMFLWFIFEGEGASDLAPLVKSE